MSKLLEFVDLRKKQLELEINAIRKVMNHGGSKGTEAEAAVKKMLREFLPKRFSIGTGFVSVAGELSTQLDIIIYDEIENIPIYKGEDNIVIPAEAVYGVIEVTMQELDENKLNTDLGKLSKLKQLIDKNKKLFYKITKDTDHSMQITFTPKKQSSDLSPCFYHLAISGSKFKCLEDVKACFSKVSQQNGIKVSGFLVMEKESSGKDYKEILISDPYFGRKPIQKDALYHLLMRMNYDLRHTDVGEYTWFDRVVNPSEKTRSEQIRGQKLKPLF